MAIVGEAAAAYASAGYFTIVEGIVLPREFLRPLSDSLTGAGHAVAYAVLSAPLDVCIARARGREAEPLADPEVVGRLWRDFEDLGPWDRHALEIGTSSAEAAADLLERSLRDGRLAVAY